MWKELKRKGFWVRKMQPLMHTDKDGLEEQRTWGGESRDGNVQTQRRVADGYSLVKSILSIRSELHSSKGMWADRSAVWGVANTKCASDYAPLPIRETSFRMRSGTLIAPLTWEFASMDCTSLAT